jgi:hypothetical protein
MDPLTAACLAIARVAELTIAIIESYPLEARREIAAQQWEDFKKFREMIDKVFK